MACITVTGVSITGVLIKSVPAHDPSRTAFRPGVMALLLAATASLTAALVAQPAGADPTQTTVATEPGRSAYGEKVAITATVFGGAPRGKVTLKDGKKTLARKKLKTGTAQGAIVGGYYHTCALDNGRGVQCWGYNAEGQVGAGSTTNYFAPTRVVGLSRDVEDIAAGDYHTCAVTGTGAAKCWGYNSEGQLGDGTTTRRLTPAAVSGLSSGVKAVTAGAYHTCALKTNGTVVCWGLNNQGQLGDGTTTSRMTPVPVYGLAGKVAAISAGYFHTCALLENGAARCWGWNTGGQLGNNSATTSHVPVPVSGLANTVATLVAGFYHTCAILKSGAVRCWGFNSNGQLGNNSTTTSYVPVPVSGLASGVTGIDLGQAHTCARTSAGAVRCWGDNASGQLGNGTLVDRHTPGAVSGLTGGVAAIATGYIHGCVLLDTGAARCWGYNGVGGLGDGTLTNRLTPVGVSGFGTGAALVPGIAVYKTKDLAAGRHKLSASYGGDAYNGSSTSPKTGHRVVRGKTKTTAKVTPKRPAAGADARLDVAVKAKKPSGGKPGGKVVVKDGKKTLGTFKVTKGKAGIRLTGLTAGKHTYKASYRGTKNWKKSAGRKTVKVRN